MSISSAQPFNFVGAYFGTYTQNNNAYASGASSITVTGLLGATVVGSTTINLTPGALTWSAIGFNDIDSLTITAVNGPASGNFPAGKDFLMDDFTYTAVPLPPSLLLLGTGLVGLGFLRRRKVKGGLAA